MDAKLIFLDIDGTLLPPGDAAIPASALTAMHKARANGHKLFLCTGRNYRMTSPLLLQFPFDGYICSAGGYVSCGEKLLVNIPMEQEQVRPVQGTGQPRRGVYAGIPGRHLWRYEDDGALDDPGRREDGAEQ